MENLPPPIRKLPLDRSETAKEGEENSSQAANCAHIECSGTVSDGRGAAANDDVSMTDCNNNSSLQGAYGAENDEQEQPLQFTMDDAGTFDAVYEECYESICNNEHIHSCNHCNSISFSDLAMVMASFRVCTYTQDMLNAFVRGALICMMLLPGRDPPNGYPGRTRKRR